MTRLKTIFGTGFGSHASRRVLLERGITGFLGKTSVGEEDAVESKFQGLQRLLAHGRTQFAFPNSNAMPPHFGQSLLFLDVALLVSQHLLLPEIAVRVRQTEASGILEHHLFPTRLIAHHLGIVSMPEAAIHKDARAIFAQHQVGMARQTRRIESVAKPSTPQPSPDDEFRLRVATTDGGHRGMTLLFGQNVHLENDEKQ